MENFYLKLKLYINTLKYYGKDLIYFSNKKRNKNYDIFHFWIGITTQGTMLYNFLAVGEGGGERWL